MNILTRVLQRKSKTFHVRGVYLIAYKSVNIYDVPGVLEEMEMILYLNVHQKKEGRLKMRRLSISDKGPFVPEEGEIFFAEVPGKGIDRKVEAVLLKDNSGCKNCVFFQGELKDLCMQINCLNRGRQLIFRRVRKWENLKE